MKYRVYIADDNELFKQSLVKSFPWEEYDCEIVGEAGDGDKALKDILLLQPDMAFLDIRMPGFSGIEITKKIKEKGILCRTVIITGYDEFDYVKECIHLGVSDYLLKPVESQEVVDVIRKIQRELVFIHERKEAISTLQEKKEELLKEKQEASLKYMKNLLLDSVSGYNKSAVELDELIHENYGSYSGFFIFQISRMDDNSDLNMFVEVSKKALKRIIDQQTRLVYAIMDKTIIVLVLHKGVLLNKEYDTHSIYLANCIRDMVIRESDDIIICISSFHKQISDICKAYEEAELTFNTRFFVENKNIIHHDFFESKSFSNDHNLISEIDHFYGCLKNEPEAAYDSLDRVYEQIITSDYYDTEYVKTLFIHACIMVNSVCSANHFDYDYSFMKSINEISRDITEARSIKEVYEYCVEYVRSYISFIKAKEKTMYSPNVIHVLDYLNSHYMEKITLQDVADAVDISSIHICRILKKEMSETFTNILNKIRIKQAIILLKEGKLKVYEIAELTGFSNYAYFYQLFKKETGISPTDYFSKDSI
ncbi:response regulator transcription factor [Butyrivibrio sp. XPD2002]|jgi:YesN/AraC family two-component response regulator|uniref:response regulator transcription factor n=1 Tax=Butyrivibrio sp. XPD2002 TaxID=1280665 RepID=UPI0004134AE7|nr:response regulator [Butyrivibrio sp. XPD2002]